MLIKRSSDRHTQNVRVLMMLSRNHNFFKVYWFFYRYSNTLKTTTEDYYHWARKSRQTTTTTITPSAATHMRKISIEWEKIYLKFKSFTTTKNWFSVWLTHTRDVSVYEELLLALTEREKMMFNQRCDLWNDQTSFLSMFEEDIYSVCWCEDFGVPIYDLHQLKIFFSASTDKRARLKLRLTEKSNTFCFPVLRELKVRIASVCDFFHRKIYKFFEVFFFCALCNWNCSLIIPIEFERRNDSSPFRRTNFMTTTRAEIESEAFSGFFSCFIKIRFVSHVTRRRRSRVWYFHMIDAKVVKELQISTSFHFRQSLSTSWLDLTQNFIPKKKS